MIKILLDTNIFIYLEDNKVTEEKILLLTKRLFDSNEYKIVIHPKTKLEIEGMKDKKQKEIFKSKIAVYKEIINPPIADEKFHKLVGYKNSHDLIDNELIFAIQRNCASYLITNDNKLKKKSISLGLEQKVLSIEEALEIFKLETPIEIKKPPFIEEKFLYELDLDDPFFDSLKDDYAGFEKWFKKKQYEEAKAFVTMNNKNITSFLMLKEEGKNEKYDLFDKPMKPCKRLKISTLKVSDTGKKIGETFVKIIMEKAIQLNVEEIYVTIFDKQKYLIDFLNDYGFHFYCRKSTIKSNGIVEKENVYIKNAKPIEEYYPFIKLDNKKAFIIPIKEKYHNILFQESEKQYQMSLDDIKGLNTSSNSLKKAYLCNSNIKQISSGDIVIFYSSGLKKSITSLGVVDAVFNNFISFDEMYNTVRKRTAYSKEELQKNYKKNKLVILFKHYYSFKEFVPFKFLLENNIVNGNIQTIMQIKINDLEKILEKCKFEKEKYIIK